MQEYKRVQLVIVGDKSVGKTTLLIAYTTNAIPGEYIPKVFDDMEANVMCDGIPVTLTTHDTHSSPDYISQRKIVYQRADLIFAAFSLADPQSLENIESLWIPEVRSVCPQIPVFLVGLKHDLRNNTDTTNLIDEKVAKKVAENIKAVGYYEVSPIDRHDFTKVFNDGVRVGLSLFKQKKENKSCCIL